ELCTLSLHDALPIYRVVDQVEHGRGWAHALLYDEPVALKRLNEAIATTQALLDRLDRGQGAAGVLVSPESTAAGKRFVAAMDRRSEEHTSELQSLAY